MNMTTRTEIKGIFKTDIHIDIYTDKCGMGVPSSVTQRVTLRLPQSAF